MAKKRISPLHRALLATGTAMGLGLSQTALAGEGELEIHAGLRQALTLDCYQPLNFGTTAVPNELSGVARIEVYADSRTPDTHSQAVVGADAEQGECTLTGSAADNGTEVTVRVNGVEWQGGFGNLEAVPMHPDGEAFNGLDAPSAPAELSITSIFVRPKTHSMPLVITDGGATFTIGGSLDIPQEVAGNADAMGGYSATITIEVDDGV